MCCSCVTDVGYKWAGNALDSSRLTTTDERSTAGDGKVEVEESDVTAPLKLSCTDWAEG